MTQFKVEKGPTSEPLPRGQFRTMALGSPDTSTVEVKATDQMDNINININLSSIPHQQ